jgi:hypothetical protein
MAPHHYVLALTLTVSAPLLAQLAPPPLPAADTTQYLDPTAPKPVASALPPAAITTDPAAFESPGPVTSADFLPPRLLSSPLHQVEVLAYSDGLHLTYQLQGPLGTETVYGTLPLVNRIREIHAVAYLDQRNKTEEFGKALVKAGEDKLNSVSDAIKDPVGTVKRLPAGASRFFGRLSDAVQKTGAGETNGREVAAGLLGVSKNKAQLAMELGVSPFSADPTLQASLTSAARAMAGGALLVNAAGMAVDGGAGAALSIIGINQTLQRTLVESTPDELQKVNRENLISLGVAPATVDRFLLNPWFSPWQATVLTRHLNEIGIDPSFLIQQAGESASEQDALYFIQVTRLYHKRHTEFRPLTAFQLEQELLCALDTNGTLIVAISADHLAWTALVLQRTEAFTALISPAGPVRALTLINDGSISARASEQLATRNISSAAYLLGPFE